MKNEIEEEVTLIFEGFCERIYAGYKGEDPPAEPASEDSVIVTAAMLTVAYELEWLRRRQA